MMRTESLSKEVSVDVAALSANELDAAHAIYNRTFDWLRDKGVRQWLLRLDQATCAKRQSAGEAFAVRVEGVLAGTVFVAHETIAYYGDALQSHPQWWMHTLVVDRAFSGCRVGARAVQGVCDLVRAKGGQSVWLHCVNDANHADVIPSYYNRLGFIEAQRRDVTYPSTGNTFPMVVMRRKLV
jgi:ribosomal protein S18 acetylase RimI-like enzyme